MPSAGCTFIVPRRAGRVRERYRASRDCQAESRRRGRGSAASEVAVPAGTTVNVRLIDGIDSTKTAVGEHFRASVDDPIVVGNRVVVPRGVDALEAGPGH